MIEDIINKLAELYPRASCALDFDAGYKLLFATRLAAQCTDARVNTVTPVLFGEFPTLEALAAAGIGRLEEIVRSCGFYRQKAHDIKVCAERLILVHGGRVPDNMDELLRLPGVGRKTANLILGEIYGAPAIIADTHCIRLSNRLGLCDTKDPYKVELALKAVVPPDRQVGFCHGLVAHGRAVCFARKPNCEGCELECPQKLLLTFE
ncbi:MAG: endonuclease III [Oscillospiraceae bacterium]|nr:endonuclease III [Oscillospiraceae bacterium]